MNEDRIIRKAIRDFEKKFQKKGILANIKRHKCKKCEYVYIQGKIFACEHCEKWCGFKSIRPLKLICFAYKRRENNGK